ncbi:MAG: hypothetical protein HS117_02480 [Verrucomicrobiaceae bacterium]|nr:hypothetical protein [Verrucomicrobiaceae bacterium]
MDFKTGEYLQLGATNQSYGYQPPVSDKEKTTIWFAEPLKRLKGDEAFIFLMVCFPLLETIIRQELDISDEIDVPFSDNSKPLQWFAEFMTIPAVNAREVWDAFRNGLLHRAMIKNTLSYELTGKSEGRPAKVANGIVTIYVWELRDKVVTKLEQHHKRLWRSGSNYLPKIFAIA